MIAGRFPSLVRHRQLNVLRSLGLASMSSCLQQGILRMPATAAMMKAANPKNATHLIAVDVQEKGKRPSIHQVNNPIPHYFEKEQAFTRCERRITFRRDFKKNIAGSRLNFP